MGEGAELSDTISDEQRKSLLTVLSETDNIQALWHTGLIRCIETGIPPCLAFDDEVIKSALFLWLESRIDANQLGEEDLMIYWTLLAMTMPLPGTSEKNNI